jgi:Tat protein translocase TatB subunit
MNLGFPEMVFIFILALIIFGPKKLPEMGRQIGKALTEFKRASNQFKAQLEVEMDDLERQTMKQKAASVPVPAPPENTIAQQSTPAVVEELPEALIDPVSPGPPPDMTEVPGNSDSGAAASAGAGTISVAAATPATEAKRSDA